MVCAPVCGVGPTAGVFAHRAPERVGGADRERRRQPHAHRQLGVRGEQRVRRLPSVAGRGQHGERRQGPALAQVRLAGAGHRLHDLREGEGGVKVQRDDDDDGDHK